MKKTTISAIMIALAMVLALSLSAWGAPASIELTFSNLSVVLNNDAISLVPDGVSGYAFVTGFAYDYPGCETVPAWLRSRSGTYNLYNSYRGGPLHLELTSLGVYDPITNSAQTYNEIVSDASSRIRGAEIHQGVWTLYYLSFSSPQDGWYQVHVTGDYTYTIAGDEPYIFGSIDPDLAITLYASYGQQGQSIISDIFWDTTLGTHSGQIGRDIGPAVYLLAGDSMQVVMETEIFTQDFSSGVPTPNSILLFSTGILGFLGRRLIMKKPL